MVKSMFFMTWHFEYSSTDGGGEELPSSEKRLKFRQFHVAAVRAIFCHDGPFPALAAVD